MLLLLRTIDSMPVVRACDRGGLLCFVGPYQRQLFIPQFYTCAAYGTDIPLALRGGAPGVRGCKAASLSSPYLVRMVFSL